MHVNLDRQVGEKGDERYKCYRGSWVTLAVTKRMKTGLNGTFNISCSSLQDRLTNVERTNWTFKGFAPSHVSVVSRYEGPWHTPTPDEILYASGKKMFDFQSMPATLRGLMRIKEAFLEQPAQSAVGHEFY